MWLSCIDNYLLNDLFRMVVERYSTKFGIVLEFISHPGRRHRKTTGVCRHIYRKTQQRVIDITLIKWLAQFVSKLIFVFLRSCEDLNTLQPLKNIQVQS